MGLGSGRVVGEGKQTGSQEPLVKTRVLTSSPVVMAFMEPVIAIALTFLPYFWADFRISVFLHVKSVLSYSVRSNWLSFTR